MELHEIEAALQSAEPHDRWRAIAQLGNYEASIAVPILISKLQDPVFLVRSFVARILGKHQTAESFAALLEMLEFERDPNVKGEACNSLSLFGQVSASHLVKTFHQDDQWLVRRSILAALADMDCPNELLDVCIVALGGEDLSVREAAIDGFALLVGTNKEVEALQQVLACKNEDSWRTRVRVAHTLKKFTAPEAKAALAELMQDEDSRVVAAALEGAL
jgi:HEAT repeat protein